MIIKEKNLIWIRFAKFLGFLLY